MPEAPFDPFDELWASKLGASSPGTGRTGGQIAAGERYMSQQMAALNRYVKEIV
ncbi:MAG: hypothetical protein OES18_13900 [Deltaproteobacteria bacterium]|nr:hypothetical protein [Deltaproteobacteria bacterium]